MIDMDSDQFREFGNAAIEYVANYMDTIRDRSVLPSVEPGYLNDKLPDTVPEKGESWIDVLKDFDEIIMPGVTHWQSPRTHAFFPAGSSYPSIVGEIFSAALGVIGIHWTASPACTELEVKMMNWLGKLLNLPDAFLNCSEGPGGGVIQGSASEATLLCLFAAKARSIRRIKKLHPELDEFEISNRLVAYTSDQANSSVEKSALLATMKIKILESDENGALKPKHLLEAIKNDYNEGLYPCYLIATLGTTGICGFDELNILGPICRSNNVWLHVDAAYAGSALILPEYQYLLNGMEYVDSFCFSPHKWLLINFECSALWVQNANDFTNGFIVRRIYLEDDAKKENTQLPEYRNWQIPLGRRFRALKVWFTLRIYGKEGLQAYIRNHLELAELFSKLVSEDSRFEIVCPPKMGLVCFRLKGEDALTEKLHDLLMSRKNIYTITAKMNGKFLIRFVVCSRLVTEADIYYSWNEIKSQAERVLNNSDATNGFAEPVAQSPVKYGSARTTNHQISANHQNKSRTQPRL